jgi:phage terminase large subunit-like protein
LVVAVALGGCVREGPSPEAALFSKLDRMAAQTAKLEAGHVHLLESAPWLSEFLYELLAFPSGRHDDQVDSVSQFLFWWQREQFLFNIPIVAPILVSQPRSFPR